MNKLVITYNFLINNKVYSFVVINSFDQVPHILPSWLNDKSIPRISCPSL